MNMKKVNMMVYPPEKVYQIYTNTHLQIVIWGGQFSRLSRNITFFHNGKRIEFFYSFFGCERSSV